MQDSLPAGWLAFAGGSLTLWIRSKGFSRYISSPFPGAYPDASWAHVRRKFYDIQVATNSAIATEAVERIGALYEIEREIRGKPPATRCEVRQARARPLVNELHGWLNTMLTRLSRKSIRPWQFAMRSHDGVRSLATWTMARSRSTTPRPKERCVLLHLGGKTICFADPMPADMPLRRSTR